MKNVVIKNLQGDVTHGASFETIGDANKWIAEQKKMKSWGLSAGWYSEDVLTEEQKANAIDSKTDKLSGKKSYKIIDQFVIEIEDITDKDKENKRFEKSSAKVDFGLYLIKYIHFINDKKNITNDQLLEFLHDTEFQLIKSLLETGNLKLAKTFIGSFSNPLYNKEDRDNLKGKITKFLKNYGEDN